MSRQVLWEHVQPSQNFSIYNGGVEAASNLLSKQHHIKVSSAEYGQGKKKKCFYYTIFKVYILLQKGNDSTAFGDRCQTHFLSAHSYVISTTIILNQCVLQVQLRPTV